MDQLCRASRKDSAWIKQLWDTFLLRPQSASPTLTAPNGQPLSTRTQAAIFLSLYAAKQARLTPPATWIPVMRETLPSSVKLHPPELRSAIFHTRRNQAADPLGLKPTLLRHLPSTVLLHLCDTFTSFLYNAVVPKDWKHSILIPLLKPGKPPGEAASYRPVAITHLTCRLLKSVVVRRIEHELRLCPLNPRQIGFRRGFAADFLLSHLISSLVE